MKGESKKRLRLTASDYKRNNTKRKHANAPSKHQTTITCSTTTSKYISTSNDILNSLSSISVQATESPFYSITPSSNGVDITTFRKQLISKHTTKPNIATIITKSVNYRFVELAPPSSITSSQPKISSFLITNASETRTLHSTKCITSVLFNMSRCVVEDVMLLSPGTIVAILVPTIASFQPSSISKVIKSLKNYNLVQFGSKSNTRYHLIKAIVKSNPNLDALTNNILSTSDVTQAFNFGRDNGFGIKLNLDIDLERVHSQNKLFSSCVDVKWITLATSSLVFHLDNTSHVLFEANNLKDLRLFVTAFEMSDNDPHFIIVLLGSFQLNHLKVFKNITWTKIKHYDVG